MKRTFILRTFSVVSVLGYAMLIWFSAINDLPFHKLWFSTVLFFIANVMLLRSIFYRINSSLWMAVFLYSCFITGYANILYDFNIYQKLAGYIFSVGYASFIVFIFFRQLFHIKTFAILTCGVLILLMYSFKIIELISFSIIFLTYVILVLVYVFYAVKSNTRKV